MVFAVILDRFQEPVYPCPIATDSRLAHAINPAEAWTLFLGVVQRSKSRELPEMVAHGLWH